MNESSTGPQGPRARLRRGIVSSSVNNSSAFGFSILITSAFGMLNTFEGSPSALDIVLFALGAAVPFSVLEAIASRGFRRRPQTQGKEVIMLGTAANVLSIAVALAVTYLAAKLLHGPPSWGISPLFASTVYMLVEAVELATAERIQGKVFGEVEAEGENES